MKKPGVCIDEYIKYIEDYLRLRLYMNHQLSSVIAARKDLNMFLLCNRSQVPGSPFRG